MIKTGPTNTYPSAAALPTKTEIVPKAGIKAMPSVTSEALLGARGELKIEHNGELYSLRRTRQGKLILTK